MTKKLKQYIDRADLIEDYRIKRHEMDIMEDSILAENDKNILVNLTLLENNL